MGANKSKTVKCSLSLPLGKEHESEDNFQSELAPGLSVHLNNKHTFPVTRYSGWVIKDVRVGIRDSKSSRLNIRSYMVVKEVVSLFFPPAHTKKKVTSQVVGRLRGIKRSSLDLREVTIVFVSLSCQKASQEIRSGQGLSNRTYFKPEHWSRTHSSMPARSTYQQQANQASTPLLCLVFLKNPLQCPAHSKGSIQGKTQPTSQGAIQAAELVPKLVSRRYKLKEQPN